VVLGLNYFITGCKDGGSVSTVERYNQGAAQEAAFGNKIKVSYGLSNNNHCNNLDTLQSAYQSCLLAQQPQIFTVLALA
jgi:hypothetical protein